MRLLVHACCGPCAIMPTRLLVGAGHDVTVFYANSNIAPQSEYDKRLGELERYARTQGFPIMEGNYDPAAWERIVAPIGEAIKDFSPALAGDRASEAAPAASSAERGRASDGLAQDGDPASAVLVSGLETASNVPAPGREAASDKPAPDRAPASVVAADKGEAAPRTVAELLDDERRRERCRACYRLRLEEAAAVAAQGGYDALTTTLAVSPYQFTDVIHEELQRAAANVGIAAHVEDWRPHYDEATRISRELGMYRQNYCGCRFSVVEGEATRAFIKQQRKEAKAAKAKARAGEEEARRQRAAEKRDYAEKQARKHAVLKQLREKR